MNLTLQFASKLNKQDKYKVIFLKILLWPFSIVYGGITAFRNLCYSLGWFKSYDVPVAVICVGNLKAGGTGKTPFTQYLLHAFSTKYKTAVLSRGYGRNTKGFLYANEKSTAAEIGDESLQLYTHAAGRYSVAVCEDRVAGVEHLLKLIPDLQLVILDDGFQHRKIKRDANILLTEYKDPFFNDLLLPAGRLREFRHGAVRADAVVVTKTPAQAPHFDVNRFYSYTKKQTSIVYAGIQYGMSRNEKHAVDLLSQDTIVLVTGIANPQPLIEYLKTKGVQIQKHLSYKDHYTYTNSDIQSIESVAHSNNGLKIITTEKDWVKIVPLLQNIKTSATWAYMPIELEMYSPADELISLLETKITKRLTGLTHSA